MAPVSPVHAGPTRWPRHADLVIGVGTRFTDFATASKTAFQNPDVRFVNINVFEMDALKHGGVAVDRRRPRHARRTGESRSATTPPIEVPR